MLSQTVSSFFLNKEKNTTQAFVRTSSMTTLISIRWHSINKAV